MGTYTHEQIDQSILIGHLLEQRALTEGRIQTAVQDSRDMGMSWGQIAAALSTSTQAAWERYGLSPEEKLARRLLASKPAMEQVPLPDMPGPVNNVLTTRKVPDDIS